MRPFLVPDELSGLVLGYAPTSQTGRYGRGSLPPGQLQLAVNAMEFGFSVVEAVGGAFAEIGSKKAHHLAQAGVDDS